MNKVFGFTRDPCKMEDMTFSSSFFFNFDGVEKVFVENCALRLCGGIHTFFFCGGESVLTDAEVFNVKLLKDNPFSDNSDAVSTFFFGVIPR